MHLTVDVLIILKYYLKSGRTVIFLFSDNSKHLKNYIKIMEVYFL
jgi:hypothetical protein